MLASGPFDVQRTADPPYHTADGVTLGHMRFAKRFHGPLDATGSVEMIAASTPIKGSAGYVAIEHVTGTLDGRAGSFILQHSGTMDRGAPSLSVRVVPDSGTGALRGLAGTMAIDIVDGKHLYRFDYTLAEQPAD
jgi:hypothetical protein